MCPPTLTSDKSMIVVLESYLLKFLWKYWEKVSNMQAKQLLSDFQILMLSPGLDK